MLIDSLEIQEKVTSLKARRPAGNDPPLTLFALLKL